jgi:hypothetical protein
MRDRIVSIIFILILIIYIVGTRARGQTSDAFLIGGAVVEVEVELEGWHRDESCNYEMIHVLKRFIGKTGLKQNTGNNWQLYIPCGYNNSESEFNSIRPAHPDQKIFIIKGCDNLSRKDTLWHYIRTAYGIDGATKLMPQTYLTYDSSDMDRLKHDFDSNKIYILKKNIQRQEGLKISNSKRELLNGKKDGYVVVQEMLQDPFIIDGRKTNCRYYLLIICKDGIKRGFLYRDGFMYYTPLPFKKGSMVKDQVITAGLATKRRDSEFYESHPLTLQQFQRYVNDRNVDIFASVGKLLGQVLKAVAPHICTASHLDKQTTFQLFGCDIAFNNMLRPQLMEINKGPDLSSKTDAEVQVKDKLISLMFQEVGLIPKTSNELLEVWKEK